MSETKKPAPKKIGEVLGGIEVFVSEVIPSDTLILGYPDGHGGFKDGWVALRGIGTDPLGPEAV